jgi:hypothetical protein
MRFLYHLHRGAQLFEEDGVDHSDEGWFDHPEKAGLVAIVDPNGPTRWVAPEGKEPEPAWIVIPADWEDLHWTQQVKLASQIAGEPVEGKPSAVKVITAELARRAS